MDKSNLSAHSCRCDGCGSDMIYNPDRGALYCDSCKKAKAVVANKEYSKHDLHNMSPVGDANKAWAEENKALKCKNCGASVVLQGYQLSCHCPYCSSALVADEKVVVGHKPDAVVPFRFGKGRAEELFKAKIKKNWFAPKKFKQNVAADNIEAYYFPAFVYDCDCRSTYSGELYESYTVHRRDGRTDTRRRYFYISGNRSTRHEGVEIEASTKLEQHQLNSVRPYDISQAVGYSNEYIAGYPLETYSSGIKETFQVATKIIKDDIRREILSGYRYDGVVSFNMQTQFFNEKYTYCILPMYRINYKYKKKIIQML
ncbi:MAG: hypothetical protein J6A28_00920 [Clostridia bacterium]|nr:hypothetical protein [Clostridia bacterium]